MKNLLKGKVNIGIHQYFDESNAVTIYFHISKDRIDC